MANSRVASKLELPEYDDEEEDIEFLYQLEAAEAQALSLSSSSSFKRRRLTIDSSNSKFEKDEFEEEIKEGAYTAALKGSKSITWQKQHQTNNNVCVTTTVVGGLGSACFKCGNEGHWARDCTSSSLNVGLGPPLMNNVAAAASLGVGVEKACPCGSGNCLLLTANTERNRGRKFFRCPLRQENGGCGFFEWYDESSGNCTSAEDRARKNGGQQQVYQRPTNQAASGYTKSWNDFDNGTSAPNSSYGQKLETSDNKAYGSMSSGSSCFKCGQQGHWAKDCLTTSSNVTPGARGNTSSNACYKCGQSGHWARDCSDGQSTKLRSW